MFEQITRVLVVDDHAVVRKSLQALLERQPDMTVVGTAVNGREAIELAQSTRPDVIIMDVSMPELDGIRATREIHSLGLPAHIIMLSMHHNSALVEQARQNGASGYIIKQQANTDLVPAIRAACTGTLSFD